MGFLNTSAFIFASLTGFLILVYLFNPKKVRLEVSSIIPWKELKDELIRARLFTPDLLFLIQLIVLLLLILTLARPYVLVPREHEKRGTDYVLIIDKSASMQTRERSSPASETPDTTRFEIGLKRALEEIEKMEEEDRMMILASSSHTETVCSFTKDKGALVRAVKALKPDDASGDLREGLDIAFAALRSSRLTSLHDGPNARAEAEGDEPQTGKIAIITDGCGFSMPSAIPEGYEVEMIQVGEGSDNVAITSLEVYQDVFVSLDKREAYVTLKNFSNRRKDVAVVATLRSESDGGRDGSEGPAKEIFRDRIKMLPGEARTLTLTNIVSQSAERLRRSSTTKMIREGRLNLSGIGRGKGGADSEALGGKAASRHLLTVEIQADDLLDVDDKAYHYVLKDRLLRILLVTQSGSLSRELRSITENSATLDMVILPPAVMMNPKTKDIWREFDIAIFDRFTPPDPLPINALYIIPRFSERISPAGKASSAGDGNKGGSGDGASHASQGPTELPIPKQRVDMPEVLDWDTSHPILKGLDYLDDIVISRAWAMDAPEWATVLARSRYRDALTEETTDFPLVFCGSPREDRRRVVVVTFELHSFDFTQSRNLSGLIMLLNIIRWLDPQNADLEDAEGSGNRYIVRTGEPFDLSLFPVASSFARLESSTGPASESTTSTDAETPGAKLVVFGPERKFDLTPRDSRADVASPDGAPVEAGSPLIFTRTERVGEYSVKAMDVSGREIGGGNRFIVNFFHPEESDIKVTPYRAGGEADEPSDRLKGASESSSDEPGVDSIEDDDTTKDEDSKKKEIARYAALIVLCFLGLEWLFYSLKKM